MTSSRMIVLGAWAAALSTVYLLADATSQAEPTPPTTDSTRLQWATEWATASQRQQRQLDMDRLAELQREIELLAEKVGAEHPRLQQMQQKLESIRNTQQQRGEATRWAQASDQVPQPGPSAREDHQVRPAAAEEEAAQQQRQQAAHQASVEQHLRQAMEHLRAAGMGDLAERVGEEFRRRNVHGSQDPRRAENPWARHDNPSGQANEMQRMVHRLAETVGHLERRIRESEEVRRAVHEIQSHVGNVQREIDQRLRRIEEHVEHQARHAEELVGDRSQQMEEAIESIERHLDRAIQELEERLAEMQEKLEE